MTTTTTATALSIVDVPIDALAQHPDNVRRHLGDLTELTKSIAGVGVLEPLGVLPPDADGTHLVVMGNRRLAAATKAGLATLPCMIRDLTDIEVLEVMLVENMQRSEITPVEEARAYARLIELDSTVAKIAKKVGRTQQHVKGRLALTTLPDEVLALIETGEITLANAADLVDYASDPIAMEIVTTDTSRPGAGGSFTSWLTRRLVERRRADALNDEINRLKTAGIGRYEPGTYYGFWPGMSTVQNWSKPATVKALGLTTADARKHPKEPCHAVYIEVPNVAEPDDVKVNRITVCLDPARHRPAGANNGDDVSPLQIPGADTDTAPAPRREVTPEEAAAAQRREAWDAADEARIAWWRGWLNKRTDTIDPVIASALGCETDLAWTAFKLFDAGSYDDEFDTVELLASRLTDAKKPLTAATFAFATAYRVRQLTDYHDRSQPVSELAARSSEAQRVWEHRADFLARLITDGYPATDLELDWLTAVRDKSRKIDAMELSDELTALLPTLLAHHQAGAQTLDPCIEHSSDLEDLVLRGLVTRTYQADGTLVTLTDLGIEVAEHLTKAATDE